VASHLDFVLQLADTNLIWSHRLSEWCGHGPVLEEDIALANVALDALGQARMLYAYAGKLDPRDGAVRSEDDFAYFRDAAQFRNFTIAELENGDYAHTIVRNLFLSVYFKQVWQALQSGSDLALREIAAKAVKESSYHVHHAADWIARFGDSTPEARKRVDAALFELWRFTPEFFVTSAENSPFCAAGIDVNGTELGASWLAEIQSIIQEATLALPPHTAFRSEGYRGIHTEALSRLLAEMQSLARAHPGAKW
jgi:ring-1,2-phenylacetyl-CoA epoxidase subunit PaaC